MHLYKQCHLYLKHGCNKFFQLRQVCFRLLKTWYKKPPMSFLASGGYTKVYNVLLRLQNPLGRIAFFFVYLLPHKLGILQKV